MKLSEKPYKRTIIRLLERLKNMNASESIKKDELQKYGFNSIKAAKEALKEKERRR